MKRAIENETGFELWQIAFLGHLNRRFETSSAQEILAWSLGTFGSGLSLGTAFGASGMVLIDIALEMDSALDIFYIDTGYFFPETLALIQRAERHYGRPFRKVVPGPEADEAEAGSKEPLYRTDPDRCCSLRKVVPMKEALSDSTAWMTALRRDQSSSRATTPILRWSAPHALVKIAPLVHWTEEEIWSYLRQRNLPFNPLHDQGYPSIGCRPCTEPVAPGADPRSGRWAGLAKTECGLHWSDGRAR